VAFRRERKLGERVGGPPVGGGGRRRIVGQLGLGHVLPAKLLERANAGFVDREPRQDDHAVLPVIDAVAPGVAAVRGRAGLRLDFAVFIEVEARMAAGVRGSGEAVREGDGLRGAVGRIGVVLRDGEVAVVELAGNLAALVVVDLI
jgi:hypothetical protein